MEYKTAKIVTALNELLTRGKDAAKGFTDAGNHAIDARLRKTLFGFKEKYERFQKEIEYEIEQLDGIPEKDASFLGELHRVWLEVRADLSEDDPEAILEECIRGESRALDDYKQILQLEILPKTARLILEHQMHQIRQHVDQLRAMKKRMAYA
jgi:uncharacterized protein (TIGR02284 family)